MRGNGAAVGLGALDGAAPSLRIGVAGGQGGHDVVVDRHGLRVVLRGVVVLICVCNDLVSVCALYGLLRIHSASLTVHRDPVTGGGRRSLGLDGHLRGRCTELMF